MTAAIDTQAALHIRAAVLSCYEVEWLELADAEDEVVERMLLDNSKRVLGPDGKRRWTLTDKARLAVVKRYGLTALRGAWRVVSSRPDDARQWAINEYLGEQRVPRLDELDAERVRAVRWLGRWLRGALRTLPPDEELAARLDYLRFLEPLRRIVGDHFIGREAVLEELMTRHAGNPVLIHGIGGIGKSAVLARHLLEATEQGCLVSYLSLEHSSLDPLHTDSFIAAIATDLAAQLRIPHLVRGATEIAAEARDRLLTGQLVYRSSSHSLPSGPIPHPDDRLLDDVGLLVTGRRVVIAIDTVEELQRRDPTAVTSFRRFVLHLNNLLGGGVVLAGRAPAPELRCDEIHLDGLPHIEALSLLHELLGDRLPPDGGADVIARMGTSPLVLRLVAGVLAKAGDDEALRDFAVRREAIEGELYRRLLCHIGSVDIRSLAHPGLTLRQVTPDLILRVLAKPCGVEVPDLAAARKLFEGLAREAMLVERVDEDTIVHRKDVRQLMLQRLADDSRDRVGAIHRAAVGYYAARHDPEDRVEELYHRLMLSETRRTLDERWSDAALPSLLGSFVELPPRSRAYLATKSTKVSISAADAREAELAVRRPLLRREVESLMEQGLVDQALEEITGFVHETGDRSAPVLDLKVQVLEFLDRLRAALDAAEEGRRTTAANGETAEFLGFSLHAIRLIERLGAPEEADARCAAALEEVRKLPQTQQYQLIRLSLVIYRLRLARHRDDTYPALVDEALELFEVLPPRAIAETPGLLRDLAAEVGEFSGKVLSTALKQVGFGSEDLELIAQVANQISEKLKGADLTRRALGHRLSTIVESEPDKETLEAISGPYKAEADAAIDRSFGNR